MLYICFSRVHHLISYYPSTQHPQPWLWKTFLSLLFVISKQNVKLIIFPFKYISEKSQSYFFLYYIRWLYILAEIKMTAFYLISQSLLLPSHDTVLYFAARFIFPNANLFILFFCLFYSFPLISESNKNDLAGLKGLLPLL